MRIKLTSAMEQEDLSSDTESANTLLAADSTETSLINEENERRSIDELGDAIDDSVDDADQLEQVRENLEAAVDDGGASPETVEMARIAVEGVCKKIGIKNTILISTENFKSSTKRIGSTKIAIEGIGDTIKRIWDSIIAAIKSMWEKVKGWWDSYFDGINKLIKKAEAVEKKLEGITADMEVIKDEKGTAGFINEGFIKSLGEIASTENAIFGKNDDISKIFTEKQEQRVREKIKNLTLVGQFMADYASNIKDPSSFNTVEPLTGKVLETLGYKKIHSDNDSIIYGTEPLAGYIVGITIPNDEQNKTEGYSFDAKVDSMKAPSKSGRHYFDKTMLPYGIDVLLKIKNETILTKLAKTLEQMKTGNKEATKAMDDLVKIVDKFKTSDEDKENVANARKSIIGFSSFGSKFNTASLSLLKRYVNVMINYTEISIPRYTKKS